MSGQQLVADKEQPGTGAEETAADGRPMRADARRNYERLVAAARDVFTEQGGGASMEAIAKHAGVGIGTLYRHFPKRIDIVEAVYRSDVDGIVASGDSLSEERGPGMPWRPGWRPSCAMPEASASSSRSCRRRSGRTRS